MDKKTVFIAAANDYARDDEWAPLVPIPLSLLSLGAYLTVHDMPVELIDVQVDFGFGAVQGSERVVAKQVAQHLRDQADTISWVGISMISNASSGFALIDEIHAALPDVPIVLGGYFASSVYQFLLQEYPFITAIVRGDGEAAALEISRCLAQGRSFLSDQTPNLAWLDDGQVRTTPVQAMKLEDSPDLDVRLLRNPTCYQVIVFMTSRGCPFKCGYCLEGSMRPYAAYSPAWVARQLAHLEAEMPNDRVFISDPIFGVGRERTIEICRLMGEHRFSYGLESRVDVLSPDMMPVLHSAGVQGVFLGVESASPSTLVRMNKVRSIAQGEQYIEDAFELLKACFENDVTPFVPIILPYPGDSEQDFQASVDFAKEVNRLYNQVVAQTGVETGFVCYARNTTIYAGIPLEQQLETDFPETVLQPTPFIGERIVPSPSPAISPEVVERYRTEIENHSAFTPSLLERQDLHFSFFVEEFLAAHSDLMDDRGIIKLGDCVKRSL